MKSIFAMLFVILVLSACSSLAPAPTSTLVPSPTMTLTQTPVPTLTPTSTMMPGIIAGMDVTQYGYNLNGKQEIEWGKDSHGTEVWYNVGGSPDNPEDVICTIGTLRTCTFKYDRDFELHLLNIGEREVKYDGIRVGSGYDEIANKFDMRGVGMVNFSVSEDLNHRERDYIRVYFANRNRGREVDVTSKKPQSGYLFVRLASTGEFIKVVVSGLVIPIN